MSSKLGIALIGAGQIGVGAHLPAWSEVEGADVRWVVDTQEEAARQAAQAWGISRWSTDHREALSDPEVHAVDVCTPAVSHTSVCLEALGSGRHVLVEKPVALSLEDLRKLRAAAETQDVVLMVAENWPFASAVRRVRGIIHGDDPWQPILLQARHESGLRLTPIEALTRPVGDRVQLGYLFVAGIHTLNLARHLIGELEVVTAYSTPAVTGSHFLLDDDTVMAARFENNAIGSFSFTGRSRHLGERNLFFRLIADRGVVEFELWRGWVRVTMDGEEATYRASSPSMGYREEIEHFVACIKGGEKPLTSADDQLLTLATLLAAYESLETGDEVSPRSLLDES